jgi:hypothetical protein
MFAPSMSKTPKHFTDKPWGSVFQNTETELVAMSIMRILWRTGDAWRPLTYQEYELERLKDINKDGHRMDVGDLNEESMFERCMPYCKSPDTAALLSPTWKESAEA